MSATASTHAPLHVAVMIDDWYSKPIREYTIDWNDPKQRQIFAEQANNAIRAGQFVTTILKDHPSGHCSKCTAPNVYCDCKHA